MSRKTTIKDIAAKLGLGLGTVSRALNGHPSVKATTREKILEAAKQLNYIPNAAARMLVSNTHSQATIGLLVPMVANQFFFEVIKWVHAELKRHSLNIMIFNTDHGHDPVIHHIIEHRMSGVLVLGDPPLSTEDCEVLDIHRVPYLYIDHHEDDANFVTFDNRTGGILAAEYLISRNCKRIVLVGLTEQSQQQIDRFSGFKERAAEEGSIKTSEIFLSDDEQSYDVSKMLLNDATIDGVFYFSDILAYGGIQAKHESGASVSIIGYDDILPSRYMHLSTIQQSARVLGTTGAQTIAALVARSPEENSAARIRTILIPELIDRQS